jgi:glycosyltransferase involved in cell wall biosynthesis
MGPKMNPLVSVVIPSFNHAAFVGETIQSVLDQSWSDFEILVTDDGSRDGTPDVIRKFSDPRIHLEVFPENRGAVVAVNFAVRRARGEFIALLNSDDYFLPGKLETQVRFLQANPQIAATFGRPKLIDERGAPLLQDANYHGDIFEAPFKHALRSRADWLRRFFFHCNFLCEPTAMVRRSIFDEIGLFDPRLASLPDFDMWVRLAVAHDIHVAPEELTAMRVLGNDRNMSAPRRDARIRTLVEYYQVLKHYRRLPRPVLDEVFAREIEAHPAWSSLSSARLLAEVALLATHPCHRFFALDTILEETPDEANDYRRLYELTGSIDLFGLDLMAHAEGLASNLRRQGPSGRASGQPFRRSSLASAASSNVDFST